MSSKEVMQAGRLFPVIYRVGILYGLNKDQAAEGANRVVSRYTGIDMSAEIGVSSEEKVSGFLSYDDMAKEAGMGHADLRDALICLDLLDDVPGINVTNKGISVSMELAGEVYWSERILESIKGLSRVMKE